MFYGATLQAAKYIVVGLANTVLTALVIFSLLHIGIGVYPSNALGYTAGILFSFIMNTLFTFSTSLSSLRFIKFISVCTIGYICNIIAMKAFFIIMPGHVYIAQIIGMIFYTATGFILNKYWSMT